MKIKKFLIYFILTVTAIGMLFPFLVMVLISLSSSNEITFNHIGTFLSSITTNNYKHVFEAIPVWKYFFNSLVVSVFTTIGQVLFSTLAGYAFARMKFKGRDAIFFIFFTLCNRRIFQIVILTIQCK